VKSIPLQGAIVAITGGGRGIGLQTARAFAARGAGVFIGDLDADAASTAAAEVGGEGFQLDVRSRESFASFLARVERTAGPVDVLVNNAGIMPLGSLLTEDDRTTEAIIDVNLRGVLWGLKLVLPGMVDRGHGHVVNVASYLGKIPAAGATTYCATKFGVVGLSEAVREELAGTGVTVSAVLPSAVRTELTAGIKLGGILPTIHPDRTAAAVIRSCRTRRAVIPVPGWMWIYEPIAALTPHPALSALRGRLARRRTITTVDPAARTNYTARLRTLEETR
jgi:NAD(P)-dependent dehydrogenase (short-subunit alcohol dehydrogenase family)